MPVQLNYPGVYVEEIPSGVHTITGVATSIAAFVGRASQGPVNEPIILNSFGDFERTFGGLVLDLPLGYAVRDFFLNGGGQAIAVRLIAAPPPATPATPATPPAPVLPAPATPPVAPAPATPPAPAPATPPAAPAASTPTPPSASIIEVKKNALTLVAASPGNWGDSLQVQVDYNTKDKPVSPAPRTTFNLTVLTVNPLTQVATVKEKFLNVSIDPKNPRFLPRVLADSSDLVRVSDTVTDWSKALPDDTTGLDPTKLPHGAGGDNGPALTSKDYLGSEDGKTGIYALEKADIFNLLSIPPDVPGGDTPIDVLESAVAYCEKRRALLLIDPPAAWNSKKAAHDGAQSFIDPSSYAAIFFPRIQSLNSLRDGQLEEFAPSGAIAGVFARTDAQRGVWKAPAGLDAGLRGVVQLSVPLTDKENGELNPLGVNCLRSFPVVGRIVWGARTWKGADILADDYKYIPVRRLAMYIEESLYRGTQWVVFEPNDEPLWSQIRLNVGAFMHNLFRQGAFQGATPKDAYFVKCDKDTTTQNDINLGVVNIVVGFAPLKPAEFVVIQLQQIVGQIEV